MTNDDDKLIKKNYLKKINLINKYNKAYYKNSRPVVDDFEYDNLKIEILELENKYKFLKSNKSKKRKNRSSASRRNSKIQRFVVYFS